MCVTQELTEAEFSRRRLFGLGAAGVAAAGTTFLTQAEANAVPKQLLTHRHTNKVVLLGVSGGPPPEIDRAGVGSALVIGDRVYVVDCGRGAVTQYMQARLKLANLRGVFITHLHSDHLIDLYDFFELSGIVNDSFDGILPPAESGKPKVQVYGPGPAGGLPPTDDPTLPTIAPNNPTPGVADFMRLQLESHAYCTNLFMRVGVKKDPRELFDVHDLQPPTSTGADFTNRAPDMEPFLVMDDGFVRVTAVLVPHGPVFPSYAYRFDSEEGSVVFSGDTSYSENVIRLAKGADMLVHEVIDVDFYVNFLGVDPSLLEHLRRNHTDVHLLGGLAEKAEVDRLVLNHLVPSDPKLMSDHTWRRNAQRGFSGRVTVGDDLMSLPMKHRRRKVIA